MFLKYISPKEILKVFLRFLDMHTIWGYILTYRTFIEFHRVLYLFFIKRRGEKDIRRYLSRPLKKKEGLCYINYLWGAPKSAHKDAFWRIAMRDVTFGIFSI